jgi:hypothetical protein
LWVSPNHPNPPGRPTPPEDDGQQLGAFPRGDGRDDFPEVTAGCLQGPECVFLGGGRTGGGMKGSH